jgi:biopolymer transport protein ExbD
MRLSKHRRPTIVDMNMTPMIDVVFNLLIFFMTVSQASEVNRERLELPKLKGSQDQTRTTLTINVNRQEEVIVSGNRITLGQLLALVSQELARVGDDPSRLTIVLRADERAACRTVNQIVTALVKLQVTRVRIAVEVPQ